MAEVAGALAPTRELPVGVNDSSCHLASAGYLAVVPNGRYCQTARTWTVSTEALAVPFSTRWSRCFHPCSRILALSKNNKTKIKILIISDIYLSGIRLVKSGLGRPFGLFDQFITTADMVVILSQF